MEKEPSWCKLHGADPTTVVRVWSALPGSMSDLFPVRVGLGQGCPLSPILLIPFMDRISMLSHGVEGVRFGDFRIGFLLFAGILTLCQL